MIEFERHSEFSNLRDGCRSSADFWYDVIGVTDDEDSDFEGFTEDDVRIGPADAESDLDIDFEAVEDGLDQVDAEDSDDGSNVDLLPQLPRGDWSTHLHQVSDDQFKEDVGICHDLDVGAEPLQYFQLFFSDSVFAMNDSHRDQSIRRTNAGRKGGGCKMAPDHR